MISIPSMQTGLRRWSCVAGTLVIGAGTFLPLGAQEPIPPSPLITQQPAGQPRNAGPVQDSPTARADGQQNVKERARVAEEQKATIAAGIERAKWRASLFQQKRATLRAEGDYNNAKLARALAEIAFDEYEKGTFTQDVVTVDGEVLLAEADLHRAEARVEWARRMFDRGFLDETKKTQEELALKKARFALEQVQSKRKVLVAYTKGKTVKELKNSLDEARSDELNKMQIWVREKTNEFDLERRIGCEKSR
jgi:hypothetical protein